MIYYRKTLFGCGPKLTAVHLTPDQVYATASGGGARIVDKFSKNGATPSSCEKDGQTSLN